MAEFENFIRATWQVDGSDVEIPLAVTRIEKSIENTLVKQRRPYRRGAKIDKLGGDVVVYTVTLGFWNECTEPGIPEGYFRYASVLEESAKVQATGNLWLGRDGQVRACLKSIHAVETAEERDMVAMTATWWEDTEDEAVTAALVKPSASATLPTVIGDLVGEAIDAGIWSEELSKLQETDLGRILDDAASLLAGGLAAAGAVLALLDAIEEGFSQEYDSTALPAASLALDPDAALFVMFARRGRDLLGGAAASVRVRGPTTRIVRFDRVVSIFDVAAAHGQAVEDVVNLNTGHLNPAHFFAIPKGTGVIIEA